MNANRFHYQAGFISKTAVATPDECKTLFFFFCLKAPLWRRRRRWRRGGIKKNALKLHGGGDTIRIGQEMLCLPYAGFFCHNFIFFMKTFLNQKLFFSLIFVPSKKISSIFFSNNILVFILLSPVFLFFLLCFNNCLSLYNKNY